MGDRPNALPMRPVTPIPWPRNLEHIYLPAFDPDDRTDTVQVWCRHVEESKVEYQLNEREVLNLARKNLKGRAADWARRNYTTITNWNELKDNLIQTFADETRYYDDLMAFMEYTSNKACSLAEYATRKWELAKKAVGIVVTEQHLVEAVISVFGALTTGQYNATPVEDKTKYPWMARVVHTPDYTGPMICSAACIEDRIFITTARCLFNAKVFYTRVYYQDEKLQPLAFVLPSKPSKDMFDDIGLIVVNSNFSKLWESVKIFYHERWPENRPDNDMKWFFYQFSGTVVGYISEDLEDNDYVRHKKNNTKFTLYEMAVRFSPWHCNYRFNKVPPISDSFFVPCYHACTIEDFYLNYSHCYPYLFGEGHIVLSSDRKICGAASWGGHYAKDKIILNPPLPIGFASMNSPALKEDLECAQKIKAAPELSDRFDTFCDKTTKTNKH